MANFNTHITVAGTASLVATAACLQADLITQPQALLLFPLATIAGILPDVDSDHSVPARMVFRILSYASATALFLSYQGKLNLYVLLIVATVGGLSMRYIILNIFTRITVHRGLFHSLPAALLSGLLAALMGVHLLHWSAHFAWLAAVFTCGGYILHLLLDEAYSVDLMDGSFKQSFGSALTLFSISAWGSYLLLYLVVGLGIVFAPFTMMI